MLLLPFVHKVHASSIVIQVNEEATVFDNRSGSLEQVGTLSAGQTFEVAKDYGLIGGKFVGEVTTVM